MSAITTTFAVSCFIYEYFVVGVIFRETSQKIPVAKILGYIPWIFIENGQSIWLLSVKIRGFAKTNVLADRSSCRDGQDFRSAKKFCLAKRRQKELDLRRYMHIGIGPAVVRKCPQANSMTENSSALLQRNSPPL